MHHLGVWQHDTSFGHGFSAQEVAQLPVQRGEERQRAVVLPVP